MGGTVNWNDGGVLETSVRAGERGPLIVLSGAAEFTNITQLIEVIDSQLSGGSRQLVIDVSRLRSADSTSIWFLLLTARTMKMHGGSMVLIRPQPAVVRVLTLVDEEQVIAVRAGSP
jgi:anti-anti-sigma factor